VAESGDGPRYRLIAVEHGPGLSVPGLVGIPLDPDELGPTHPAGRASIEHLGNVRAIVMKLAEEAGLRATESFTRSWHILMKGSIVCAAAGDTEAGKRAQEMAKLLIEQHR
jgi:hypothetical protein